MPWKVFCVSGQRLVISPGNAEITHVRRQQWLVSQVITHLAPPPLLAPSRCRLFVAIPEATDLGCGGGVGKVTSSPYRTQAARGTWEGRNQQVNNDSFGNEQLGVCYLHVRDPLLRWLAQLCGRIRVGAAVGREMNSQESAVTSYRICAQVRGRRAHLGPAAARRLRGSEIYFPSAKYIISKLVFSRSFKFP